MILHQILRILACEDAYNFITRKLIRYIALIKDNSIILLMSFISLIKILFIILCQILAIKYMTRIRWKILSHSNFTILIRYVSAILIFSTNIKKIKKGNISILSLSIYRGRKNDWHRDNVYLESNRSLLTYLSFTLWGNIQDHHLIIHKWDNRIILNL